jgi:diguanylate cyclase (GGDEF)-like protein
MNTNKKINNVISNTVDNGIIVLDKNLNILAWNKWLEIFTNKLEKDVVNQNICNLFDYINKKKLIRRIKTVLVTNNPVFYNTDQNGFLIDITYQSITHSKFKSMQQYITIVPYDLEEGQVCLFIYDKTSLCETNAKLNDLNMELKDLTHRDHLTGLYNRRFFADEAIRAISISLRKKSPFSIIMMDIDNFKNINDTYGHHYGDKVICEVSDRLKKLIRKSDVAVRFGGEEFVLLLYETTQEDALKVAENIRREIDNLSMNCGEHIINFTISFGVTQFDAIKDETNIENTIARADHALYKAKQTGRNRVVLAK